MGEQADILFALEEKKPEKDQNESENKRRGHEHIEHEAEIRTMDDTEQFQQDADEQDRE
jgi:hypothetical protein